MSVKIDKIHVKGLGPIKEFSHEFGIFNLIYSPNEMGKTFLTEFIICSLFKNTKRWKNIRKGGKGKVWVSGLGENSIEFSPSAKQKLENFWEGDTRGLPPSMSKLLVARGAEAAIESEEGGISKSFIKEILSGVNILDTIDKKITKTVRKAEFNEKGINITQQGEGLEYKTLRNVLGGIDNVFEKIESQYSLGVIETLKLKEKGLVSQLEDLIQAKRHLAYILSEEIRTLENKLSRIPEDALSQISTDIGIYKDTEKSYKSQEAQFVDVHEKSWTYPDLVDSI